MSPLGTAAEVRAFLHAAAGRIEGAAFRIAFDHEGAIIADRDHLYVDGRLVASRMGPNVVLSGSETMYPHEGVESLVMALESRTDAWRGDVRHAA